MKKTAILIICVIMLFTSFLNTAYAEEMEEDSNTIILGRYEQDDDETTGEEAIDWWILDEDGDKMLLISLFALDVQSYDDKKASDTTWENSYIRNWLNNDFYNSAFTDEEKKVILKTTVYNDAGEGNPEWENKSTPDTEDNVFLLSASEFLNYFGNGDKCYYTSYAQSQANMILKETGSWLLRSPGKKSGEYAIADGGKVKSIDSSKATGICPAIWIDTSIDRSDFPYERFLSAGELYDNEQYLEAATMFDELNGYNDSYFYAASCLYDYGYSIIESTDYEEIIKRFEAHKTYGLEKLDDYIVDTDDIINEAYYNIAIEEQENGNYSKAIELYTRLGQYQDSMKRLKDCYTKTNINWENIISKTHNAGTKGYDETVDIKDKDPHMSFDLGHFFISGFTSKETDNGTTVYLKTPGDNITLWFELEDDIDDLKGNGKLSIVADEKGIDGPFRWPKEKSDFGRGALIVKHIDSKNNEIKNLYRDYLAAKETGGADTKIEIKEEGTYEIALDYLVKDSDIKNVLNSTNGYRTYIKFIVKNGSGMIYLFDLGNGSELQDYTISSTGFRIDMAKSNSVKANVIRYELNQNWTALDARENRPAANGDTYEKPGYYVITMTNTETNSTLEKHLFVGDNEDLENYIQVDSSLSKFSY